MNKITLNQPLMINGQEVKELTYDTSQITAGQFCEAEVYKFAAGGNKPVFTTYEFDHSLHLYIGMMAIIAKNPHIDIKDLERVKGYDMIKIATVGRNFILTGAGENSDQNSSGDTSETMQEPLTPALENSETAN
jgi:hypothetical protein|nr:MAG TPA: tail assembly chaperone protein [Caudoviricetes sp.]